MSLANGDDHQIEATKMILAAIYSVLLSRYILSSTGHWSVLDEINLEKLCGEFLKEVSVPQASLASFGQCQVTQESLSTNT